MPDPTASELTDAFRRHGVEPPLEYLWIVEHRTLGFAAFSQFDPWQFCDIPEILPLAVRWPKAGIRRFLIPFARLQGSDDLACFEFDKNKSIRVCHVHYDLGPPVYVEITSEYANLWQWLHAALDDVQSAFERSN